MSAPAARLLLLIPSTSYRVADFMAAAGRLGVEVAVGSERRQVLEKYSDGRTVTLDFRDISRGTRQIVDYAGRYPLSAILGVDEATTVLAARAAAALGLAANDPEAVAAAVDKHRFRRVLAAAGLPGPGFRLFDIEDDPATAAAAIAYPCVLKPVSLSASRGVIRADDPAQFAAAFGRIRALLATIEELAGRPAGRQILVEDYLPGAEVALEGLLDDGRLRPLALFDKPDPLEGPYFEETLYVTPSRLPAAAQDEIAAAAAAAVAALGLRGGPVHAELRLTEWGPVVIDLAARSIGGLCARTLRFGVGVSLEDLILAHALGRPLASLERERRAAGVMMIPIPRAGILQGVAGQAAACAVPGIDEVTISLAVGQRVVPLPEGDKYLGFIFAGAETPDDVEAALRAAHAELQFEIGD